MAPPMHHQQQKRWPMPRPEGGLRWGSWCSRGPSMPRAASSLVGGCAAWLARVAVGWLLCSLAVSVQQQMAQHAKGS
eukprot:scaffold95118_cov19-Tisochrysis_lutea.AAC.2